MHPVVVLHKHFKKRFRQFTVQLKALMAAVDAVLCGAQISITSLDRSLPSATFVKHKIKRMDRLIGNIGLYQDRWSLYTARIQWLARELPHPLFSSIVHPYH